jgi:D-sedoheptulose 7-phosphate isomerase
MSSATIRNNIDTHLQAVQKLTDAHIASIQAAADTIAASLKAGGKVMIAGNGGSASDAQHIAGEFIGRFLYDRRPLAAIALNTDTAVLTCVGNDYSYDDVYLRQVLALANPGDVFWGLSTSGNSRNILAAAEATKQKGGKVVAFVGGTGGKLLALADVCFVAPADRTNRIQEVHALAYHIVCQLVEETLCPK